MKSNISLSILGLSLLFFSCQKESKHIGYVDKNEALVETLTKIKGDSRTYNYDFKILENPRSEGVSYYKPTSIDKALACIPSEMGKAIHIPKISILPFVPGTEKANIVTFWSKHNKLVFQIQASYFENTTDYKANNQDFLIISATQLADNPFIDNLNSDKDPIDLWIEEFNMNGESEPKDVRIYQKLDLTPELPLFFKGKFRNWSTMYPYYAFFDNKIEHTSTGSKMYYAWHDGLLFQIGYKLSDESFKMESIVREIILGS